MVFFLLTALFMFLLQRYAPVHCIGVFGLYIIYLYAICQTKVVNANILFTFHLLLDNENFQR